MFVNNTHPHSDIGYAAYYSAISTNAFVALSTHRYVQFTHSLKTYIFSQSVTHQNQILAYLIGVNQICRSNDWL